MPAFTLETGSEPAALPKAAKGLPMPGLYFNVSKPA